MTLKNLTCRVCNPCIFTLNSNFKCKRFSSVPEKPTYNEVSIQMISRKLQKLLFDQEITSYGPANTSILDNLKNHGIDCASKKSEKKVLDMNMKDFQRKNVKDYINFIATELTLPYIRLLNSFIMPIPERPKLWSTSTGWTKYSTEGFESVETPKEDIMIFDTEVLVKEGHYPTIAVALSPTSWYSWVSPRFNDYSKSPKRDINQLVPLQNKNSEQIVIGHFVSYDRARIRNEYSHQQSNLKFLDTMAMHICVSGLTSTQRYLKTSAIKRNFNNKVWRGYLNYTETLDKELDDNDASFNLNWLPETSLNNLLDVYKLYCQKEPPQTKESRSIFVDGKIDDVRDNFQTLMNYCSVDVSMTYEIFKNIFPLFRERFPHPASLFGMLEMGSMYLPVNKSWYSFIDSCDKAYDSVCYEQKSLLMNLAEDLLARYGQSDAYKQDPWVWDLDWSKPKKAPKTDKDIKLSHLPKWYRDLIPKPVKDNVDKGCALITTQMRISVKLLRLCWRGLPLHYDQNLKWGVLIPGKVPKPFGDPAYYSEGCNSNLEIKNAITVVKRSSVEDVSYDFPYGEYLKYWAKEMRRRLENELVDGSTLSDALTKRVNPSQNDVFFIEELKRSIDVMPIDSSERNKLVKSYSLIKQLMEKEAPSSNSHEKTISFEQIHENIGEMQVMGPMFWQNKSRFSTTTTKSPRFSVSTVNPEIPTCWFEHLPHESGYGKSVGNPLSKGFQRHIANGTLHSDFEGDPEDNMADRLLFSKIKVSFWQSYSKRIKDQMVVWENEDTPSCDGEPSGAILPQVITAGTVTRRAVEPLWLTASNAQKTRIGSEVKAMIQTPKGYCFVGADVDSQEMWIASLIGDATVGLQGGTPYGWMTLEGSKSDGTDLHSKVAKMIGITRDEAKVLNYSRLYGSGLEFTTTLLSRFAGNISTSEAKKKAEKIIQQTKGKRVSSSNQTTKQGWSGGSESEVFNQLESIAKSYTPKTPFFNASITRALSPSLVKNDFLPSRVNWVVQSSAVDYLHCLLVCMAWRIKQQSLNARLCISIHDEVKYMCEDKDKIKVALALQISNLLTRAFFAYQVGMQDLPQSVAFFSSVEIDTVLRKNPEFDCVTPSNPHGLENSMGIKAGQSLTMEDILELTHADKDE